MSGVVGWAEEGRGREGGGCVCVPDGRARTGQKARALPVRACPFDHKLGLKLGRERVESGQKTDDDGSFASAC